MSEYYKKAIRWKQHVQILIMLLSSCWSETVGQRSNTSTRCVSVVFKLVSGTKCFITFSLERSECRPPHSGTDGWSAGQQTQVSSKAQSGKTTWRRTFVCSCTWTSWWDLVRSWAWRRCPVTGTTEEAESETLNTQTDWTLRVLMNQI